MGVTNNLCKCFSNICLPLALSLAVANSYVFFLFYELSFTGKMSNILPQNQKK